MKRMVLVLLCAGLLLTAMPASVFAAYRPIAQQELQANTATPDMSRNISLHLNSSMASSNHDPQWSDDFLTQEELADIADFRQYGFSAIGVNALERPAMAAVDGVWSAGNTGEELPTKRKMQGAFSWSVSGLLYDVHGQTGAGTGEGFRYQTLFTLNFGKIADMTQLGFVSTGNPNNFPQAGDLYISNDGENWIPVGYWDRCAKRMNGDDYGSFSTGELGADAAGNVLDDGKSVCFLFDLPENTSAQYLRIAITATSGISNPKDPSRYDDYSSDGIGKTFAFRELFVLGALTDRTGAEVPLQPTQSPTPDPSDPSGTSTPATSSSDATPDTSSDATPGTEESSAGPSTGSAAIPSAGSSAASQSKAPSLKGEASGSNDATVWIVVVAVAVVAAAVVIAVVVSKKKKK